MSQEIDQAWVDEQVRLSREGELPPGPRDREAPAKPPRRCQPVAGVTLGKVLAAARTILSDDVPPEVAAARLAACRPRVGECCAEAEGELWCSCCGCGQWAAGGISSALSYKVSKAGFRCPRGLF